MKGANGLAQEPKSRQSAFSKRLVTGKSFLRARAVSSALIHQPIFEALFSAMLTTETVNDAILEQTTLAN